VKSVSLIWGILLKQAIKIGCVVRRSAVARCACCLWSPRVRSADHQWVALTPSTRILRPTVLALLWRTWVVVVVLCKIAYYTVKKNRCNFSKGAVYILRLNCFFRFTVLRKNIPFYNILWRSAFTVHRFIAKSVKFRITGFASKAGPVWKIVVLKRRF
jgi:hypothetical protein